MPRLTPNQLGSTPKYTPAEDDAIRRHYARQPRTTVVKLVNRHAPTPRSWASIRARAARINANGDRIPRGHTRLVDAHDRDCGHHSAASLTIIKAARAAGVLKQATHVQGSPYVAPTPWVEAWLEQHYRLDLPAQEQADTDVLGWISTREFAARLGIDKAHAANRLIHERGRLRKLAANARRVRLMHRPGRPLVWHPDDVDQVVRAFRPEPLRRAA